MKREIIINAMNDISDAYLQETIDELYFPNCKKPQKAKRNIKMKRLIRAACFLTVIVLAGAGTVYAALEFFHTYHREAEEGETYEVKLTRINESGETETYVPYVFEDPSYVFKFEGPEVCKEVEFKANWVPFEPNERFSIITEDGYSTYLSSEATPENESYGDVGYKIELFYLPQYIENSALVFEQWKPTNIQETVEEGFRIIQFQASDKIDNSGLTNYVMKINEEDGYGIICYGGCDASDLKHIVDELEIHETGRILDSSDLENMNKDAMWMDPGVG